MLEPLKISEFLGLDENVASCQQVHLKPSLFFVIVGCGEKDCFAEALKQIFSPSLFGCSCFGLLHPILVVCF